jgi:hypothetical protein
MSPLLRHLQLRPHGDHLLTSSGAFWLFSARTLIVAMALAESVAWGRLGYVFGERSIGWIAAVAVSLTIFIVVWIIDVSLITMDRAWREHSAAILGYTTKERSATLRSVATVGLRLGLLFGSLYVTAPYLAQVVFYKDIQRFIDAEAVSNIDKARKTLVTTLDANISTNAEQIAGRRLALEREVAGGGISRRYGYGPAADTIASELTKQEAQAARLAEERKEVLTAFDLLARDWRASRDRLAASYGVALPQTSILENTRALDALRQRPEYQSTELAVKAFLAFVFFGLLLLKMFEPTSIRLYLSEVLQQEYIRYLAGTFDDMLPDTERSSVRPSPMTPQRLYDFLANEWAKEHHQRARQDSKVARRRAISRGVQEFEGLRRQLHHDVVAAETAYREACAGVDDARQSVQELESALEIVKASKREYEEQLKRARDVAARLADHESRLRHVELTDDVRQKLRDANQLFDRLNEQQPAEKQRAERALEDQDYWRKELLKRREELTGVAQRIHDLRFETSESELLSGEPVH